MIAMHPTVMNLAGQNVNTIFPAACHKLLEEGVVNTSRNGPVLHFEGPTVTEYFKPRERVLFYDWRDCNHFFQLFESMWMLAGREDLQFVTHFNKGMAQYSDDGKLIRGSAYGKRWRSWFGYDQLEKVIRELSQNRDSRRAVLTQWDAATDPVIESKDIPCNTQCYVKVTPKFEVNLTVVNRSNDVLYGCYGSNVVHFSIVQEYIAARLGLKMGRYYQFSDNLHAYTDNPIWKKAEAPGFLYIDNPYYSSDESKPPVVPMPLNQGCGQEFHKFDEDLKKYFSTYDENSGLTRLSADDYQTDFWKQVLVPMNNAFIAHRERNYDLAHSDLQGMPINNDWRKASTEWLERRQAAQQRKKAHELPTL